MIFSSFIIAFLLKDFGVPGVFVFIAAAVLAVIGFFGPRASNVALERISHQDA